MTIRTALKTSNVLRKGILVAWMALASCTSAEHPEPRAKLDLSSETPGQSPATGKFVELPTPTLTVVSEPLPNKVIEAKIVAAPTNDDPKQLLGLTSGAITELLGVPGLVRHDHSVEVWQYKAVACILDVFLYADGEDKRVRYVELRGHDDNVEPQQSCFAKLLEAEAKPHSG